MNSCSARRLGTLMNGFVGQAGGLPRWMYDE